MNRKYIVFLALIVSFFTLVTCSKRPEGKPAENEIWIEYKLFNPSRLIVKVGTTVTFTNKANANHSITNIGGTFDSGRITSGNSYSYLFSNAGTYSFYCKYHNEQAEQGYIVVEL